MDEYTGGQSWQISSKVEPRTYESEWSSSIQYGDEKRTSGSTRSEESSAWTETNHETSLPYTIGRPTNPFPETIETSTSTVTERWNESTYSATDDEYPWWFDVTDMDEWTDGTGGRTWLLDDTTQPNPRTTQPTIHSGAESVMLHTATMVVPALIVEKSYT